MRGLPFHDDDGPDRQERGAADEAFAAVVLDDDFVAAAAIHEPSAAERILHAALERAESEAAGEQPYRPEPDLDPGTAEFVGDLDEDADDDEGRFDRSDYTRYLPEEFRDADDDPAQGTLGGYAAGPPPRGYVPRPTPGPPPAAGASHRPYGTWGMARWRRPVACVLAMVMGISVIALALIAIQRAGAAQRGEPTTPEPASPAGGSDERPRRMLEADPPEEST